MATKRIRASLLGMRFYDVSIADAARALSVSASAQREPRNPHDPNAIAIVSQGRKLGHVDRETAAVIAPLIDAGATCAVAIDGAKSAGGRTIPIVITLSTPVVTAACPIVCKGAVAGIYEIRVERERKSYFGQSVHVQDRIKAHWSDLSAGWHANPELQRHWDDYGPQGFLASLKEVAPTNRDDLDLAHWLLRQERHHIEQAGGMRAVINAEWPGPVLNEAAKKQLERERNNLKAELSGLSEEADRLERNIADHREQVAALEAAIAASKKWFGLFVSADVMANAMRAPADTAYLQQEIARMIAERDGVQRRLQALKDHLFL